MTQTKTFEVVFGHATRFVWQDILLKVKEKTHVR
jgi:hypothetical protein